MSSSLDSSSSKAIPVWLDCDPGHDDAFAILLAAYHPSIALLGISTVHGNSSLVNTTSNAGSVVTAIGKPHIPIYPGAATPFCRKAVHAADIHGETGLDGTTLLPTPLIPPNTSTPAIIAMRDALTAQPPNTAWLVATGTLTNVALLFAVFPELAAHIKGLSIMGGAVGGKFTDAPMGSVEGEVGERFGNRTRFAEFNIYVDPESAAAIFRNPVLASKTILIPLDLTHTALADASVRQMVLHGNATKARSSTTTPKPSPLRQLMYEIMCYTTKTYTEVFNITAGPPLHDALAMAYVMFAEGAEAGLRFEDRGERWGIEVVTDGKHSEDEAERGEVGRTVVTRLEAGEDGVFIPRALNVQGFWEMLNACVGRADEELRMERKRKAEAEEDG